MKMLGIKIGANQPILSPTERLRGAVDLLHHEGKVEKQDRDMFGGLLDLRELQVSDVMVHRTEMVMINADLPPEELVREVLATEYTRIPLWRDKPENIIGVLHAKDLLRAIRASEGDTASIDVSTIALPPWFVPEMRPVSEQLKAFRRRKTHFALVVDEYGEVEGMVTLEDILEEIVGDISDEHDVVVAGVRAQPDGSVVVDGSVPIRDLNRAMDWHLPDEEATTVAGLVIHEARSIPERGQSFTFHGFRFRVLRRERNRITALRIVPVPREAEVEEKKPKRAGTAFCRASAAYCHIIQMGGGAAGEMSSHASLSGDASKVPRTSWYFTCLGAVWKWPLQFQHALFVDLGVLVGNHLFRDHGVEHGVLLDQVLEHGAQFFGRKLIAERFRYFGVEDGEIVRRHRVVERHQDAFHQHFLGGGAGHVEGESVDGKRGDQRQNGRSQPRVCPITHRTTPSNGDAPGSVRPPFAWNEHRARDCLTKTKMPPPPRRPSDATDPRFCGTRFNRQARNHRPVVSPGACALIASAWTEP